MREVSHFLTSAHILPQTNTMTTKATTVDNLFPVHCPHLFSLARSIIIKLNDYESHSISPESGELSMRNCKTAILHGTVKMMYTGALLKVMRKTAVSRILWERTDDIIRQWGRTADTIRQWGRTDDIILQWGRAADTIKQWGRTDDIISPCSPTADAIWHWGRTWFWFARYIC